MSILVRGRVQGVGFRAWTARRALQLGVCGWVRNRRDGAVEIVAAAPPDALERFLELLRQGPPLAQVEAVEAASAPAPRLEGFEIR